MVPIVAAFVGGAIGMALTHNWIMTIVFGVAFAYIVDKIMDSRESKEIDV